MANQKDVKEKVKVKALVVLRDENFKRVEVGGTLDVSQSIATLLVEKKQAELVEDVKVK